MKIVIICIFNLKSKYLEYSYFLWFSIFFGRQNYSFLVTLKTKNDYLETVTVSFKYILIDIIIFLNIAKLNINIKIFSQGNSMVTIVVFSFPHKTFWVRDIKLEIVLFLKHCTFTLPPHFYRLFFWKSRKKMNNKNKKNGSRYALNFYISHHIFPICSIPPGIDSQFFSTIFFFLFLLSWRCFIIFICARVNLVEPMPHENFPCSYSSSQSNQRFPCISFSYSPPMLFFLIFLLFPPRKTQIAKSMWPKTQVKDSWGTKKSPIHSR